MTPRVKQKQIGVVPVPVPRCDPYFSDWRHSLFIPVIPASPDRHPCSRSRHSCASPCPHPCLCSRHSGLPLPAHVFAFPSFLPPRSPSFLRKRESILVPLQATENAKMSPHSKTKTPRFHEAFLFLGGKDHFRMIHGDESLIQGSCSCLLCFNY